MSVKRYRTSAQIRFNIQSYLNREFVNRGLYFNIASGHLTVQGNRADVLRRVNGNLYESYFNNWIYETDASGVSAYPTVVCSGVYINDTWYAKNSSPYKPIIDYNNGRILFNGTAISSSATVSTAFSYKQVIVNFPESNIVNQIFSQERDNTDYTANIYPSGNQRQIPLVIIDLQDRVLRPWQLGGGKVNDQRVVFHVLTNNDNDLETICDILTECNFRHVIQGIDFNLAPELLTYQGDKATTYKNYNEMQIDPALLWSKIYIDDTRIMNKDLFFDYHRARVDWRIRTYESALD